MDSPIVKEIATNMGKEPEEVSCIIDEFLLQLHKRFLEYKGLNGDYIGEELHYDIGKQGFYHFLGILDYFSANYEWQQGIASEYLLRLGSKADWLPYSHQMESWVKTDYSK